MGTYLLNSGGARTCRAYYGTVQLQLHTCIIPHACYIVERNNHACTYKFTHLHNTCDSYTSRSHMCAIYFLVLSACESRLLTQFYKSNATSALVAG